MTSKSSLCTTGETESLTWPLPVLNGIQHLWFKKKKKKWNILSQIKWLYSDKNTAINEILNLNIISIIDLQFENTLNKVNLLNLDVNGKLSTFINESIKYNSFNFIDSSEFVNKNNFQNIISNNLDLVRVFCEINTNDITKCSSFLINIIADILNKPKNPSISINDSIIRIYLNTENHDTVKQILYKIDNNDYLPITKDLKINIQNSIDLSIKVQDLFQGESSEIKIKLF